MSQEDFAREIGVSLVMIDRWENDKVKPSGLALRKIEALASKTAGSQENSPLSTLNQSEPQ